MGCQFHMRGRQTAPDFVFVDDVIVDQGPGMVDLYCGGGIDRFPDIAAEGAAGPENQRRTDPFAAADRIGPHGGAETFGVDRGRKRIRGKHGNDFGRDLPKGILQNSFHKLVPGFSNFDDI